MPSSGAATPIARAQKGVFRKSWVAGKKKEAYNFSAANDILGIVMLEIQSASDLPKLKNSTFAFMHFFLALVIKLNIPFKLRALDGTWTHSS